MRKILKDINAFAMAELLAVSIVILLIFTVLFSNYLPLVSEYETRLSYNDVTSQYAAHYIRKEYKNWLEGKSPYNFEEEEDNQAERANQLDLSQGFTTVYKKSEPSQKIYNICLSNLYEKDNCDKNIKKIINDYGIEEIIITKYKLNDPKDKDKSYVKNTYQKKDGVLKKYIDYLPNYEKSIYTGKDADNKQLYRLIMKTKYGYATTAILDDYNTPGTCFGGYFDSNKDGLVVTKYYSNKEECGPVVTIKNQKFIRNINNNGQIIRGSIVQIGDGTNPIADGTSGIEWLIINNSNLNIAKNAFLNKNNLQNVSFPTTTSASKLNIGESAFNNTGLNTITLPAYATYGNFAFANNKSLSEIDFSDVAANMNDSNNSLATNLFEKAGSGNAKGISLSFPLTITQINPQMFYMAKLQSIEFNDSLQEIGEEAFAQQTKANKNQTNNNDEIYVTIPKTVTAIGDYAFNGLKINNLIINEGTDNMTIGTGAFYESKIKSLTIPKQVSEIKLNAFNNNEMEYLSFAQNSKLAKIGESAFNGNFFINVKLPDTVEEMGARAFANNLNLKMINIPNNLKKLSEEVFNSDGNLSQIFIPASIMTIEERVFQYCSSLEQVDFAQNSLVSSIGSNAFSNTKLSSIALPASVKSFGNRVFSDCSTLKNINSHSDIFKDEPTKWCNQFYGITKAAQCENNVSGNDNSITVGVEGDFKTITYMNSEEVTNG